jgi:hypothetical protein
MAALIAFFIVYEYSDREKIPCQAIFLQRYFFAERTGWIVGKRGQQKGESPADDSPRMYCEKSRIYA